jgi:hypothetical protein
MWFILFITASKFITKYKQYQYFFFPQLFDAGNEENASHPIELLMYEPHNEVPWH